MSPLEKLYSVEEIAEMTSLTSRTIRNYLKDGSLKGRKIGGQWRFTEEDIKGFMNQENVQTSIRDEVTQSVYDFMDGVNTDIKGNAQMCSIIDLYCKAQEASEKAQQIMELLKDYPAESGIRYHYESSYDEAGEGKARFIIYGSPRFLGSVCDILDPVQSNEGI
ncbi:MAG: helix-turn-helix domain-containing protein [Cellulosilyticaceae bacterium]